MEGGELARHGAAARRRRVAATSTGSAGSPSSSTGSPRRWPTCAGERPLAAWIAGLTDALDALTATTPADAWQTGQARAELADAARAAGPHAADVPLGLADVRGLLAERLRGRPSRANFRTGTLTVATMVPMRSVPHRVVCLLGLDDGAFPRAGRGRRRRRPGPRPPRRRARSAQRGPPAAPRRGRAPRPSTWSSSTPAPTRAPARAARLRCRWASCSTPSPPPPAGRALRPDRRPAPAAALRRPQLHRRRARRARAVQLRPRRARRASGRRGEPRRRPRRSCRVRCLPAPTRRPSRSTTSSRSSSTRSSSSCASGSGLPISDDGRRPRRRAARRAGRPAALGRRRPAAARPAGRARPRPTAARAEWRRGELPPGALGNAVLAEVLDDVEELVAASARFVTGVPESRDVDVAAPGRHAAWSAPCGGVHGDATVRVEFSKLAAKQRVRRVGAAGRAHGRAAGPPLAGGDGRARVPAAGSRSRSPGRWTPPGPRACSPTSSRCTGGAARAAAAADEIAALRVRPHAHRGSGDADDALAEAPRELVRGPVPASATTPIYVRVFGAARPVRRGAHDAGHRPSEPTRFGDLACGCGARCSSGGAAMTAVLTAPRSPSTSAADLPTGTTVLEASAGTGKTFTIAALAARYVAEGHRPAAGAAAGHLRPRGHPGAARAGPRAAGRAPSAALRDPAAARGRDRLGARAARERAGRRGRAAPAPARPPRWPTSTPRPSRPRTSSASRCSPASASLATSTRTRCSSRTSTTWWSRSSTTSTCASSAARRAGTPAFDAAEALRAGPPRGRRPAGPAGAGRTRPATAATRPRRFADGRARRGRAAQAARAACSTYDDLAHPAARRAGRPATAAAPAAGCGPATGWCWSTSSRTPTRCSGRSCGAFHGHAHAGADRRPEAGDLRVPRRGRRHLPGRRRASPTPHATLARNWRSDAGLLRGAGRGVRRRRARRPADRRARRSRRPTRAAAGRSAGRRAAAGARAGRATGCPAAAVASRSPRMRAGAVARDVAADVAALLASGATVDGRCRCGPATSPCWCAPTTRAP